MKLIFFIFILFFGFTALAQCDSIPLLNKEILSYANSKLNKKVGRGECWDLAKYALDEVGASWDGEYKYGRKLDKDECIYPGDIIQFEKIKVKYKEGNQTFTEEMPHHTAIVFSVNSKDEVILIHQNTAYTGKKVGKSKLRFSTITSGKYYIYRPQK